MAQAITFHGAAETVTGSRHLLDLDGHHVLVDCGLFQGPREIRERNWQPLAFSPDDIDAVILTHAHTDHIGFLPRLWKLGYRGPVYATPATIGIAKISLPDGGRLQEEDAEWHARHGTSRHAVPEPLYTEADSYEALKLMRPVHQFQWQDLPGKGTFRFLPAGHILGAAFAEVYFANGERILMSGDLGRYDRPILKDPTSVEFAEYLVLESTYGDRLHGQEDPKEILLRVFEQAERDRGVVLVPSFAIGRTQELLWDINELRKEGRLPRMPIYVDSPMARSATEIYRRHDEEHDKEMRLDVEGDLSPFADEVVQFTRDKNMSKALNDADGPMMIIAGSGMLTGGRILHHLRHRLADRRTTLLFTGFQAEGSLGRQIIEGATEIEVYGSPVQVRAQVEVMDMLSAHADYSEILRWLGGFRQAPKRTFLVHGEPPAQAALKARIESELAWEVVIPRQGQSFPLD